MSKIVRLCDTLKQVSILFAAAVKNPTSVWSLTTGLADIRCLQVPKLHVLGLQDESTLLLFH
jgi:hypothetical protein